MLKKYMTYVLLMGVLLGLAGGVIVIGDATFAQDDNLLRLSDLPEGAIDLEDKPYTREQMYHPINNNELSTLRKLPEDEQKILFSYQEIRSFSAVLQEEKALVAHFIYVYETAEQASTAVDILRKGWLSGQNIKVLHVETLQDRALRGYAVTIEDEIETPVYWFIGHDGKTLTLLMVDGLEESVVNSVSDSVMEKLFEKHE